MKIAFDITVEISYAQTQWNLIVQSHCTISFSYSFARYGIFQSYFTTHDWLIMR